MLQCEQVPTLSVSAIKDGTVIDHIDVNQALAIVRHLKFAKDGVRVTIGLNLKSSSRGLKDIIKLEDVAISPVQASQIAVFSPNATVNTIENYKVNHKYRVTLPSVIENILVCPNPRCITHAEKVTTLFNVEETVLLRCKFCEKTFRLQESRVLPDD